MSRFVAGLVYQKKVGWMARKSILAYCAERANDDGSGVWASKVRIAQEVECSKQTVIDTMKAFCAEGLAREAGKRRTTNGFTVVYDLNVAAILALPDAIEDPFSVEDLRGPNLDGSNELTPRGQATGPQGVKPVDSNRPLTVHKPSNIDNSKTEAPNDLFREGDEGSDRSDGNKAKPSPEFERFWKAYPASSRKVDKIGCAKLFGQIVTGKHKTIPKVSADRIIHAVGRYAADTDPNFIAQPRTWLNQCRWEAYDDSVAERSRARSLETLPHMQRFT